MKKTVLAVMMACAMSFGMGAAVNAEGTDVGLPEGSKIGFSTITLASEFFAQLDDASHEYFDEAGYDLVTVSCEMNAATQVSDIENLIAMGCDGIILFATDPSSLEDVCAKAVSEGVKVYLIAATFENRDSYTCILGTEQYDTGVNAAIMAAEWIDETFPDAEDGSVEVCVIGNTTSEEASARTEGMLSVTDLTPKATVVETFDLTGATDTNIKSQEFADMITGKYPDCKVVLAYGVDAELGSNEVFMRDSSLDRAHFGIFGVDTSQVAYEQIKLSQTDESVIRGTVNLGDDLALNILELVRGDYSDQMGDDGVINTPQTLITAKNIDDYVQ